MHLVPEQLNILDDSNMAQIATMERRCQEILAVDMSAAGDTCSAIIGYITGYQATSSHMITVSSLPTGMQLKTK